MIPRTSRMPINGFSMGVQSVGPPAATSLFPASSPAAWVSILSMSPIRPVDSWRASLPSLKLDPSHLSSHATSSKTSSLTTLEMVPARWPWPSLHRDSLHSSLWLWVCLVHQIPEQHQRHGGHRLLSHRYRHALARPASCRRCSAGKYSANRYRWESHSDRGCRLSLYSAFLFSESVVHERQSHWLRHQL